MTALVSSLTHSIAYSSSLKHRIYTTSIASVYPHYLAKGKAMERILRAEVNKEELSEWAPAAFTTMGIPYLS